MEWQPIETAPKDGSTVLVALPDGTVCSGIWREADGWSASDGKNWIADGDGGDAYWLGDPTHWMPLPEPPHAD